ncbi:alpha/beta fold hydrolase BchO [Yoonia sp.]|uniref:alpha/beta fold hydrolase BchO n=1 Tax=Yoonia sp. TaxID=2212373 RepID=UPI003919E8BE
MRWPPRDWPLSEYSRQILHRPHRWHVQEAGQGPLILLIHGAGGATQSFRHLFPVLTQTHHVVAIDLPGQGFSQMGARQRAGLDHMTGDILSLCRAEGWNPAIVVGHSAGGAIALRLWELGLRPGRIVLINAALSNFKGVAGLLFPFMAKALAATPFSASIVTATSSRNVVQNLIRGTGSVLDEAGVDLYHRLITDRGHIDGTLAMMAQWSLDGLLARLADIIVPVHLITGANDKAVPPSVSHETANILPQAKLTELPGLGHLAHEEDARTVANLIMAQ